MNALGLTSPIDEIVGNQNVTFTIVGSKVSNDLNSTDPISQKNPASKCSRNNYVNNSPSGKRARKRSLERLEKLRHSKELGGSS